MAGDKGQQKTEANEQQPVTKALLDEAVQTLLQGMDNLSARFKGELDEFRSEANRRFDKIETDVSFLKREAEDRKADLFDTPTRKEFNELKARVDRYHPTS